MSDKPPDGPTRRPSLIQALTAWRDVRERIFRCDGMPPPTLWTELGHAEHTLMEIAREIDKPMEIMEISTWDFPSNGKVTWLHDIEFKIEEPK